MLRQLAGYVIACVGDDEWDYAWSTATQLSTALIVFSSSAMHSESMSVEVVPVGEATGVRDPDQRCHDRGSVVPPSVSSVGTEQGEYANLVTLQHCYAELASGSSGRDVLTDSVNALMALVRANGPPRRSYRVRSVEPSAAR